MSYIQFQKKKKTYVVYFCLCNLFYVAALYSILYLYLYIGLSINEIFWAHQYSVILDLIFKKK